MTRLLSRVEARADPTVAGDAILANHRRYVICRNEEEVRKDAHDREAIITSLREALRRGDKSLVGNKGYRRYLRTEGKAFSVDEDRIEEEARYDGTWVLRTNTVLPTKDVALTYKRLWSVEEMFRSMKSLLSTRPIWHKCDETIRGHVFCTYLALVLRKALEDRLETAGIDEEWAKVLADLDRLTYVDVDKDGKRFRIRSTTPGCAGKVLQATGVAIPPTVTQLPKEVRSWRPASWTVAAGLVVPTRFHASATHWTGVTSQFLL